MTELFIKAVLDRLDDWRHLPDYQLERRADIYFALFLPVVLEKYLHTPINPTIIPEFPLKKDGNNQSNKVDYFALSADCTRAFFVELKTDLGSVDDNQISYYSNASGKKLCDILCGLKSIVKRTNGKDERATRQNRLKYLCLLQALATMNLVQASKQDIQKLRGIANQERAYGWTTGIEALEPMSCDFKPQVIYVLPNETEGLPSNFTQITFEEFAKETEKRGALGKRFAKSLRYWAEVDAGSAPLGTVVR